MSYIFGRNFINTLGKIFEIFPNAEYVYPSKNGFAEDAAHLRSDARKVEDEKEYKTL